MTPDEIALHREWLVLNDHAVLADRCLEAEVMLKAVRVEHEQRIERLDTALAHAAEAEALTERLSAQIVAAAAPLMAGHVNGDDAFACLAALARAASVAAEAEEAGDG